MKITLAAVCAVVLAACWQPTAGQDQSRLFVWAFQDDPILHGSLEVGAPCTILGDRESGSIMAGMPLFVTIENERHEVVYAWQVVGEITEAPDGGHPCQTPDGFSLPLPEASFWLVYVNDQFIAAYSPETLPKDDASRLPILIDFDLD